MELWIRSQDKESLRKINYSLYLHRCFNDFVKCDAYFILTSGDKLGEYKTKERALEILDEIQDIIDLCTDKKLTPLPTAIYEMPKE